MTLRLLATALESNLQGHRDRAHRAYRALRHELSDAELIALDRELDSPEEALDELESLVDRKTFPDVTLSNDRISMTLRSFGFIELTIDGVPISIDANAQLKDLRTLFGVMCRE